MKNTAITVIAGALALTLGACSTASSSESETENVQIANPWMDYETIAELAEAAGFQITLPEQLQDVQAVYRWLEMEGIEEIQFEDINNKLVIRAAKGEKEISGDYGEYADVVEEIADAVTYTLKGNDGKYNLAEWFDGIYSYAVSDTAGMDLNSMLAFIKQIKVK